MTGVVEELLHRVGDHDRFGRWSRLAAGTGYCTHPIRLSGHADTVDSRTGEVQHTYDTANEPDGTLLIACGNRRASRCPSCSATYRSDTWQLVAAGLRGGKGIPDGVGEHPRVFVTLTAPSFGLVHSLRAHGRGSKVCRPRRGTCSHGRAKGCSARHADDDPLLGAPLCAECFDYERAVLWNAVAPELWRRTTEYLRRALAAEVGLTPTALKRRVRLSYTKVAEYQARGAVHFHAVIRLDAAPPKDAPETIAPPPREFTVELLVKAIRQAVDKVAAPLPDGHTVATWGNQLDIRVIRPASTTTNPTAIAAYIAKYATKSTEALSPGLDRRLTAEDVETLDASDHVRKMVTTCWRLGGRPEYAGLRLRQWAHMLGFRGHFSTRSRRYSVTLGFLRAARAAWTRQHRDGQNGPVTVGGVDGEAHVRVGHWRMVGIGYRTRADELLAQAARDQHFLAVTEARELRRREQQLLVA